MKKITETIAAVFTALLIVLAAQSASAEDNREPLTTSSLSEKKRSIGGFPVVFYSDETRIGAGGGVQIMLDDTVERFASSAGVMAFVTQNKQYTFIVAPELYLKDDMYKLYGNFGYSYFPDSFYGLGRHTSLDDEEKYTGRLYRINPILQKKISRDFYIGLHYDYLYGKVVKSEKDGRLANSDIPGFEGGGVSGAGIVMTWDSRDNNLYPVRGSFHQITASSYGSLLGSDYTFNSYMVDLRHYRRIFDTHVLAFQGITCITTGQPSFQYMNDMSSLGKYLRGYTQTLYVDKNVLAFQTEYRMPLYGRFGLVAFAGFGQIAERIEDIAINDFKPSGGVGLRFALIPEQKVNLRIDAGFGDNDSSFDISFMETF